MMAYPWEGAKSPCCTYIHASATYEAMTEYPVNRIDNHLYKEFGIRTSKRTPL